MIKFMIGDVVKHVDTPTLFFVTNISWCPTGDYQLTAIDRESLFIKRDTDEHFRLIHRYSEAIQPERHVQQWRCPPPDGRIQFTPPFTNTNPLEQNTSRSGHIHDTYISELKQCIHGLQDTVNYEAHVRVKVEARVDALEEVAKMHDKGFLSIERQLGNLEKQMDNIQVDVNSCVIPADVTAKLDELTQRVLQLESARMSERITQLELRVNDIETD